MYERSEAEIMNFIENSSPSTKKNIPNIPSNKISTSKTCMIAYNVLANSKKKSVHTLAKEQKERVISRIMVDEAKYIKGEYSKS